MKLTELNDKELVIALNNLTATYYACFGHTKADRNEQRMEIVIEEMKKRGFKIPTVAQRLEKGAFNGIYSD